MSLKTAEHLRGIIGEYMQYYNFSRSHPSLGYISPYEFECRMND
jgi:putative transposase